MANEDYTALLKRLGEIPAERERIKKDCEKKLNDLDKEGAEIRAKLPPAEPRKQTSSKPFNPSDRHPPGKPPGRPR